MTGVCTVVVIGHVDHGKTALVRALTGTETDRLAEERQRGLSIVPGFAHCSYAGGIVDLIDAPGHSDFISAMVAGATGARAALLIVSLADGIEPQTVEHIRIMQSLGVESFTVALTKSDLVLPVRQRERCDSILSGLDALGITPRNVVTCSAHSGAGLDDLHSGLQAHLQGTSEPNGLAGAILPIDRVFAAKGHGTVVTGTLIGGALRNSDRLTLLPAAKEVTIRNIQSRGADRKNVQPDQRVALNLRGVAQAEIARGAMLAVTRHAVATQRIDISLSVLTDAPKGLKHMETLRVHFGTAAETARLALYGQRTLTPGENGFAQLRFDKPVAAYRDQPALLRSLSPFATLASARFMNPGATPARGGRAVRLAVLQSANEGSTKDLAEALCIEGRGLGDLTAFGQLADDLSEDRFQVFEDRQFARLNDLEVCRSSILAVLDRYFTESPLKTHMPDRVLKGKISFPVLENHACKSLLDDRIVERRFGGLSRTGYDPERHLTRQHVERMAQLEQRVQTSGMNPPPLAEITATPLDQDLLALLLWKGRLAILENVALNQSLVFHSETLSDAMNLLRMRFPPPDAFTTSEAREALATTRKFIVPVLEHFDQQGATKREGNLRWFR